MGVSYNAHAYEAGRPGYPAPAVTHLLAALRVGPESEVLDLAAGTGKFTRELIGVAKSVIAVEPDPGMRDELARSLPAADVLDGLGTSLPVADDAVDAVTIAQAYHWFAGREALVEIGRVVRPGGRLGLIWNVRDLTCPVQQGIEQIFERYRGTSPTYRNSGWRASFDRDVPFGRLHGEVFPQSHVVDRATLTSLTLSMSYMSRVDAAGRELVSRDVAAIFARNAYGNPPVVDVRYRTEVFWSALMQNG